MKSVLWSVLSSCVLFLGTTCLFAAENETLPVAGPGEIRLQVRFRVSLSAEDLVKTAKNPFPFEGFRGRDDRLVIQSQIVKTNELALVRDSSYSERLQKSSDEESRELLLAMDRTMKAAQQRGITILSLDCSKPQSVQNELQRKGVTHVVLITGTDASGRLGIDRLVSVLKQQGIDAFVLRDLLPLLPCKKSETSPWRYREQVAGQFERHGGKTIVSTDLTGLAAFRFQADKRPKVCFLVSDDHYNAEKVFPLFGEYLMDCQNIYCVTVTGEGGPAFHPLAELDGADSLLVFFRRLPVPTVMKEKIDRHLAQGKGLVGLRTSSHAFDPRGTIPSGYTTWPEFDRDVQGGNYNGHGPNDASSDIAPAFGQENHPLLSGLVPERWHSVGSLYYTGPIHEDAVIVQVGSTLLKDRKDPAGPLQRVTQPLTWLRYYGANRARIACSSLGHPADFNTPQGRELFARLILWSMDRPFAGK